MSSGCKARLLPEDRRWILKGCCQKQNNQLYFVEEVGTRTRFQVVWLNC